MASEMQDWLTALGRQARTRPRRMEEVLEVRQNGDAGRLVLSGERILRVLVVDNDRDTADSMGRLVKRWRHDVRTAYDGATALELTSAYQPDVMLLDLGMPRMNGYELARQFRRQPCFQDSLLIAITGYADQARRLLSEEAGFDLFLVKPVPPSTMETLLLLEQHRLAEMSEARRGTPRTNGILLAESVPAGT